jgi:hypothetical protein
MKVSTVADREEVRLWIFRPGFVNLALHFTHLFSCRRQARDQIERFAAVLAHGFAGGGLSTRPVMAP